MFFNDHNPPHFHVVYGDFRAVININDEIVEGFMPKRALKLVFEWMDGFAQTRIIRELEISSKRRIT